MPDVQKFITPVVTDASINLVYDGKVLDLQLDNIASSGSKDIGYVALAETPMRIFITQASSMNISHISRTYHF